MLGGRVGFMVGVFLFLCDSLVAEAKRHGIPQVVLEQAVDGQYLYGVHIFLPDPPSPKAKTYRVIMWERGGHDLYNSPRVICSRPVRASTSSGLLSCYGIASNDVPPRFSIAVEMEDQGIMHLAQAGGLSVMRVRKTGKEQDFLVTESKYLLACTFEAPHTPKASGKGVARKPVAPPVIQHGWQATVCDYRSGEQTSARR